MKIISQKIVLLLLIGVLSISAAIAQTDYGLRIANQRVTSDNASDLSVLNYVDGTIYYDHATKTLTLDNANITFGTSGIFNSSVDNLKIKLIGQNSITIGGAHCIYAQNNTKIIGSGTLTMQALYGSGIYINTGETLTVNNCTLNIDAKQYGIYSAGGTTGNLILNSATIRATGQQAGSITGVDATFNDCLVRAPLDAYYSPTDHAVIKYGEVCKEEVVISKEYKLFIASNYVNSATASDLSQIDGFEGGGTYDYETNTLTLNNATITSTNNFPNISNFNSSKDDFKIILYGTNTLSSNTGYSLELKDAEIEGPGSLTCNNDIVFKYDLYIKNCNITIPAPHGIKSTNEDYYLHINNSTLNVGCIKSIRGLWLYGCAITTPTNAYFSYDLNGVAINGNLVTDHIIIEPGEIYPLRIAGVWVSEFNASDLSIIPGVDGTVTYDKTSKTLTLNNATIEPPAGIHSGIKGSVTDLKVNLMGSNEIKADKVPLYFEYDTEISGNGYLKASNGKSGCQINGCNLTIKDCSIEVSGSERGFTNLGYGNNNILTIENATVKATGGTDFSIGNLNNLVLNDCEITTPAGAAFNESLNGVALNGSLVTEQVVIESTIEKYDLKIAEVQVNANNADNLSVIDGVSGTVSYDNATKTLTLNNATINAIGKRTAIFTEIEDLKINLIGENEIKADDYTLDIVYAETEINGNGSLKVISEGGAGYAISFSNSSITIKDCTVEAVGNKAGFYGSKMPYDALTINNATVKATGETRGSITDLSHLILNNCEITAPEGATFDASAYGVVLNGQIVKEQVVIEPVVAATGVSVNPPTTTMLVNGTQYLTATVQPANATNQNVSWSSSNNSIATVDANGLVTGVSAGTATITATTDDGGFTDNCTVTVETATVAVTGVTVTPTTATVNVGNTQQITATVQPTNATNQNVSWTSSDNSVATVGANGLVTGVAEQFTVEIYNVLGKLVTKKVSTKQISVVDLPAGIYMLKFKTEKGVITKKIIK